MHTLDTLQIQPPHSDLGCISPNTSSEVHTGVISKNKSKSHKHHIITRYLFYLKKGHACLTLLYEYGFMV